MLPCPLGVCHPGQIGLEMNLTSVSSCSLLPAVLGFPGGSAVNNLPANAGDMNSIPESERSPGEGNDNPLQHSYLETSMDRVAWRVGHDLETKQQYNLLYSLCLWMECIYFMLRSTSYLDHLLAV